MFDRAIEESIEIAATPRDVWWQLTSLESYPHWNPFIIDAPGPIQKGRRIVVTLSLHGLPPLVVRPRLTVVELRRLNSPGRSRPPTRRTAPQCHPPSRM